VYPCGTESGNPPLLFKVLAVREQERGAATHPSAAMLDGIALLLLAFRSPPCLQRAPYGTRRSFETFLRPRDVAGRQDSVEGPPQLSPSSSHPALLAEAACRGVVGGRSSLRCPVSCCLGISLGGEALFGVRDVVVCTARHVVDARLVAFDGCEIRAVVLGDRRVAGAIPTCGRRRGCGGRRR
jgi:hypothetical protein